MKLSGNLPKGNNGLAALDQVVINAADVRHVVIAVLSTKKIITDMDTGEAEAQMRIDRIERVCAEDATTAETLLRRAIQKRSGETVLPIEIEDDISEIFREAALDIYRDNEE